MFQPGDLNNLLKDAMSRLNPTASNNSITRKNSQDASSKGLTLTPSNALVIAGLLSGSLNVLSVLIDRDQAVQIVLEGSLKQKTDLEKMLDQIGSMPFDDVLKAILGRYTD